MSWLTRNKRTSWVLLSETIYLHLETANGKRQMRRNHDHVFTPILPFAVCRKRESSLYWVTAIPNEQESTLLHEWQRTWEEEAKPTPWLATRAVKINGAILNARDCPLPAARHYLQYIFKDGGKLASFFFCVFMEQLNLVNIPPSWSHAWQITYYLDRAGSQSRRRICIHFSSVNFR